MDPIHRIVELDPSTGSCVTSFTVGGTLKAPRSLTSDGGSGLWIADAGQYKIVHTTNGGSLLGSTGAFGEGNNQFRSAHCVFLDGSFVDVCDTFNYRIQRYTVNAQGAPVWSSIVGGTKPVNGGFNGAFDVTYDSAGNIYAVDWFNHRIEKFDANGNFLAAWGGYGSPNGSFIFPRGVTYDQTRGQIVVTFMAVLEMAMRGAGQIRRLAQIAGPETGVVTNIGVAHMELLGSREAIAEAIRIARSGDITVR